MLGTGGEDEAEGDAGACFGAKTTGGGRATTAEADGAGEFPPSMSSPPASTEPCVSPSADSGGFTFDDGTVCGMMTAAGLLPCPATAWPRP